MFRNYKIMIAFFVVFSLGIVASGSVFGISSDFQFVIDTIGVPRYNVYGEEINEDVYYTYNVLSYSTPELASSRAKQGFASVSGGLWSSLGGKYAGNGISGEYYYIGRTYSGSLISNVRYPVSFFPETTPNHWNYVSIDGAYSSWQDSSKYKYIEQLEYMKNTPILYDTLDFENRVTNPYNLVEYGICANDIGFDKVMLDTVSSWKTCGALNVVRKEKDGSIRYAIFATAPMAASASVKSDLSVQDSYTLCGDEEEKNITISFGAHVENLNDYAKIEHIKEIKAELYINGNLACSISGNKKGSVNKNFIISINRDTSNSYPLYIEVKSSLYTEFAVDGLMRDGLSKNVNVIIESYKEKIESADLKLLSKDSSNYLVSDIIKTNNTNYMDSCGAIQGGNHLCIKVKTDYNFENIDVYLNNKKQDLNLIYADADNFYIDIKVPEDNEYITINSWAYLREKNNNYFNINYSDIGTRVKNPNILKVEVMGKSMEILFDVIDRYNININYDLPGVINGEEIRKKVDIKSW